jgi:hypothetical protein
MGEGPLGASPYLRILLGLLQRLSRKQQAMHMEFPADHPIEEVGRNLLAVLLKHQGSGHRHLIGERVSLCICFISMRKADD